MRNSNYNFDQAFNRRIRIHELTIALIQQQKEMELIDPEAPSIEPGRGNKMSEDPARWLDRNHRLLKRYQALVRTAITIDALLEAEQDSTS